MFPTQLSFPKQDKQQFFSNQKIPINYALLESFYQNLVDQSIRPSINDFFELQDKIDIRQKFDKYQQAQIINDEDEQAHKDKNDGINIVQHLIKKDIVFNVLNMSNQLNLNTNTPGPNGSKINYFVISQTLKNVIIGTQSIFKKSVETKRRQKQSIDRLHSFIHQDEAVFFLLKGSLQIHKKISPHQQKNKKSSNQKNLLSNLHQNANAYINNHQQLSRSKDFLKLSISNFLHLSNNIEKEPNFHNSNHPQNKIASKEWKKHTEVKQHSFFCLRNYKVLNQQNWSHQNLKIIPKTACILAKINVNPTYGNQYLETKNNKFHLISSFLSSKKEHDPQKLQHLKSIIDCFEQQKIKRETFLSFQGRKNEKIYIIQDDGDVEFSKCVNFNENENFQGSKKLQIFNLRGKTIINAQSYLGNSKNLVNILRSNSFLKQSEKLQMSRNQQQQLNDGDDNRKLLKNKNSKKNEFDQRQILQLQNEISPGKRQTKIIYPPLNPNGKMHFGQNQQAYLQFYLPKLNQSNFTVKVNSAFITVYSIDIAKFQQIATQKMKKNLAKNYELIYITLLRKSLQRLELFKRKIQASGIKKTQQIKNYVAMTSVKQSQRFSPQLKIQNNINVSPAKLDFQHKKSFKGLKRNDLVFKQAENLEKKIQILDHNDKSQKDKKVITQKFKKKIENIIIKNLNEIKNLKSARTKQDQKDKMMTQVNQFFMGNLGQILNTERFKNQKYMVTLDQKSEKSPQKQMKNSTSAREVIQKDMFVDPSVFDPAKNKSMKISLMRKGHPCVKEDNNFLKGVEIQGYADTIKTNVAVRINETNKIKQQFLKIQSKCESCKCYDDLDSYRNLSSYNSARPGTSQHQSSSHDVKYHTMKIGVNWKTKYSQFNNKIESKTAYDPKSLHNKMHKIAQDDEPFERVYNKIKVLKQKSMQKFNFNEHLLRKGKYVKTRKQRKKSLPLLL